MIKGCPKGHDTVIKPEDNYCWQCGTKLESIDTPRCSCGYHFVRADIFCPNCGVNKELLLKQRDEDKNRKLKAQKQFEGKVSG